jgi:tetratricopeptide (TPR) repeat protein
LQTPNVCTGCHLDPAAPGEADARAEIAERRQRYLQTLEAARTGDSAARDQLAARDRWALDWCDRWYEHRRRPHFAPMLAAAWRGDEDAAKGLVELITHETWPDIVRASALAQLQVLDLEQAVQRAKPLLNSRRPLLRTAAVRAYSAPLERGTARMLADRLSDPVRLVRREAARIFTAIGIRDLTVAQQQAYHHARQELDEGLQLHGDLAGAQVERGQLAELQSRWDVAMEAYQTAIRVQPLEAGPRSHLAALLERLGDTESAQAWRREEVPLLAKQVARVPEHGPSAYRYALALYLAGQPREAVPWVVRACELEPRNADFALMRVLLLERLQDWSSALAALDALQALRPHDPEVQALAQRLRAAATEPRSTP